MIIRKAKIKDIKEIAELATDLMHYHSNFDSYFASVKNILKIYNKDFKKWLKSNQKLLLVAEEKNNILGFATGEIKKGPAMFKIKRTGTLEYMFVKEGFRKQGIGKIFFEELLKWFKKKKIEYVIISVHSKNNIGKDFWKKNGFEEFISKQRIFIKNKK